MQYQGIPRLGCASYLLASLLLVSALLLVILARAQNTLASAVPSGAVVPHSVAAANAVTGAVYIATACPDPDAGPPAWATADQEAARFAALAKSEAFDSVASAQPSPTHLASRSKLLALLPGTSFPGSDALLALRSTSDLTPILIC